MISVIDCCCCCFPSSGRTLIRPADSPLFQSGPILSCVYSLSVALIECAMTGTSSNNSTTTTNDCDNRCSSSLVISARHRFRLSSLLLFDVPSLLLSGHQSSSGLLQWPNGCLFVCACAIDACLTVCVYVIECLISRSSSSSTG